MKSINLNSDIGEGFGVYDIGNDNEMLKIVNSANIACGFHAGDPNVMDRVVKESIRNGVSIGAHPGFNDLWGFGRRQIYMPAEEIEASVAYQIGALLVAVSGSFLFTAGHSLGLTVAAEAYADRSYEDDGNMTSRKYEHAMIKDPKKAADQVRNIVIDGYIVANSGKKIPVEADTICIHGDEPTGPAVAQAVKEMLEDAGIKIQPLPDLNLI